MKTFLTILGVVLAVAGTIISAFTGIPAAEFVGVAVSMLGASIVCSSAIKKATTAKARLLSFIAVILIAIGGFLLGCLGFTEDLVTQLISIVSGITALVIGMITAYKVK